MHAQHILYDYVHVPSTRGKFLQVQFGRVSALSLHQNPQVETIFQTAELHCSACSAVKEVERHGGRGREREIRREGRREG